jgi:hypothetical protein
MESCKPKKCFILKKPEHGRDHDDLILTGSFPIWFYRRQDGRVQLMTEFESSTYPKKFKYKAYIGDISFEEFESNFEIHN